MPLIMPAKANTPIINPAITMLSTVQCIYIQEAMVENCGDKEHHEFWKQPQAKLEAAFRD